MITTKKQPSRQRVSRVTAMIDKETGEEIPVVQVNQEMEDRDFNFHKLWFGHFIQSLDSITNKRLKLAFWIIDHLDSNNKLIMSTSEIAEETGISLRTVKATIKTLQEGDVPFLKKIGKGGGAYMVNPAIVFKGAAGKRMAVMYDYSHAKKPAGTVTDINTAKKKPRKKNSSKEKTA